MPVGYSLAPYPLFLAPYPLLLTPCSLLLFLLILNSRDDVGHLFQSVFQGSRHHGLHKRVEFGLDGETHLAALFRHRQELYPEEEGEGRFRRLELYALGFLALDDTKRDTTYGRHFHRERIVVERKILNLVFWHALLHPFHVVEVAHRVVY